MGSFALSDLIIMEGWTDQQTDKSPVYVRNLKQNEYYIIAEDWWTGTQPPPLFSNFSTRVSRANGRLDQQMVKAS